MRENVPIKTSKKPGMGKEGFSYDCITRTWIIPIILQVSTLPFSNSILSFVILLLYLNMQTS